MFNVGDYVSTVSCIGTVEEIDYSSNPTRYKVKIVSDLRSILFPVTMEEYYYEPQLHPWAYYDEVHEKGEVVKQRVLAEGHSISIYKYQGELYWAEVIDNGLYDYCQLR